MNLNFKMQIIAFNLFVQTPVHCGHSVITFSLYITKVLKHKFSLN